MMEAALAAEDAKQARRPVKRREKSDRDEDEAGKGKRRPRARKPRKKVQRESIPRDGAACLVLVPARGGEPRRLKAVAPDATLVLGRAYDPNGDTKPPDNFFAACPNEKCPKISRSLVRIDTTDNKITVANLAKKDTQRVLLDGVVVNCVVVVVVRRWRDRPISGLPRWLGRRRERAAIVDARKRVLAVV